MDWTQEEKEKLFYILEKIYKSQEEQLRLFRQYDNDYHREIEVERKTLGDGT